MAFAHNLKMLLGVHTLPAGEVAAILNISQTTMSYWLNGHRDPAADNLIEIADFFRVPPGALMRDDAREFIRYVGDPERYAQVEDEIFDLYRPQEAPTPIRKKK